VIDQRNGLHGLLEERHTRGGLREADFGVGVPGTETETAIEAETGTGTGTETETETEIGSVIWGEKADWGSQDSDTGLYWCS
jgi:hypothetical protein